MVYNVHATSFKTRRKAFAVRAWLNGEEVTNRCFYADPRRHVVRMFKHDANGVKYVANGEPAVEERRGRVVVRRKKKTPLSAGGLS